MLGDLENQLVQLIKESSFGRRLKTVDSLPDLPDKDVLKRWGVDAPAAYVVAMDGTLSEAVATPQFVVVLVARNARGHQSARHGDRSTVGLYEMLDAGIALLHGGQTADASWQASGYQFMQDAELRNHGLQVGLIAIKSECDPPQPDAAELMLGDFTEFHADYDLDPDASAEDRQRWADEDHTEPVPDMQSHINPQEGT